MTQKVKILRYIKRHGTITQAEALSWLGVSRLASRIYDLRADGWAVTVQRVVVRNRDNEKCLVAEYSIDWAASRLPVTVLTD